MIEDFDEVLAAARGGDEGAWSVLYDSVAGQMLGYLRARGAADPEAMVGDAFLQIARGLDGFEGGEGGFRSWVFTIAHHHLIDDRRARSRRPTMTTLEDVHVLEDPVDVEAIALEATHPIRSHEWLQVLTEEQQTVVLLRVLGGLSAAETAELIGKKEGAVRVIQHRGLTALREHLKAENVTPGTGSSVTGTEPEQNQEHASEYTGHDDA